MLLPITCTVISPRMEQARGTTGESPDQALPEEADVDLSFSIGCQILPTYFNCRKERLSDSPRPALSDSVTEEQQHLTGLGEERQLMPG